MDLLLAAAAAAGRLLPVAVYFTIQLKIIQLTNYLCRI